MCAYESRSDELRKCILESLLTQAHRSRCEQICDYGAAAPLIKMLDMKEEVCQLSAAGCLNELSRLRRNKLKISHTGGFQAFLKVLDKEGDFLLQMVQEKGEPRES